MEWREEHLPGGSWASVGLASGFVEPADFCSVFLSEHVTPQGFQLEMLGIHRVLL